MRRPSLHLLLVCACCLFAGATYAPTAGAAVTTLDFETGPADGELVTNQYGSPGVPPGPTFIDPASLTGFSGVACTPPHIKNGFFYARNGVRSLILDGCQSGEFWATGAALAMGYTVQDLDFWLRKDTPTGGDLLVATAFRPDLSVAAQSTAAAPSTGDFDFTQISLHSGAGADIAFVMIETGTLGNSSSPTGVFRSFGARTLLLDDLSYDAPSSPPDSSFVLGASPPSSLLTQGVATGKDIAISVNWFNNPSPGSSPVTFSATTPSGIDATFTTNPSTTGTTMNVAATAAAATGAQTITVTGTVDGGTAFEKTATKSVSVTVMSPFSLSVTPLKATACTPELHSIHVGTEFDVTSPVTVKVTLTNFSGMEIVEFDGTPQAPGTKTATATKVPVAGSIDFQFKALTTLFGSGSSGGLQVEVSASGLPTLTDSFETDLVAPSVSDVVDPGSNLPVRGMRAPMFGRPGDKVKVTGKGICPGNLIEFGSREAAAAPSVISADSTQATVIVPRYATDGPVTVLRPNGSTGAPSSDVVGASKFKVAVDSFRNRYAFPFDNRKDPDGVGEAQLIRAFGKDLYRFKIDPCEIATLGLAHCPVTTPLPDPQQLIVAKFLSDSTHGGMCYGISRAEGMMYQGAGTLQYPPYTALRAFDLDNATDASPPLLDEIRYQHLFQASVEQISQQRDDILGGGGLTPIQVTQVLRQRIQQGFAANPLQQPIVSIRSGSQGHAMLVYDYEDIAGGGMKLFVADPNGPFMPAELTSGATHKANVDSGTITIDAAANHWNFDSLSWGDAVSFKTIDVLPPSLTYQKQATAPSPITLATSGIVIFGTTGDVQLSQFSDAAGNKLLNADGSPAPAATAPPGGASIALSDGPARPANLAVAPAGKNYVATAPRGAGAITALAKMVGASAEFGTGGGDHDSLALDAGGESVTAEPGAASKLAVTFTRHRGALTEAATLTGAAPSGGGARFGISKNGHVAIAANKKTVKRSALTLAGLSRGGPVRLQIKLGSISARDKFAVTVGNWGDLSARKVSITRNGRRIHARVSLVRQKLLTGLKLRLARAKGGKVRASLSFKPRRGKSLLGAGVTFAVLDGRRVLATQTSAATRAATGGYSVAWTSKKLNARRLRVIAVAQASALTSGAPVVGVQSTAGSLR